MAPNAVVTVSTSVLKHISGPSWKKRLNPSASLLLTLLTTLPIHPLLAQSAPTGDRPVQSADPASLPPVPEPCPTDETTPVVNADWPAQPGVLGGFELALSTWLTTVEPALVARLTARPSPEIHERARLAKVPVIMYHDILPEKEVFFDVTVAEFEAHLQQIRENGLTPISLDQLVSHLSTGMPLPDKPILLTFDDGYAGHYTYVYPLLKRYNYPAVFAIYTAKVGQNYGRSSLTWEQLREMAADPRVTIASHSVNHPEDLRALSPDQVQRELVESKRILEEQLGIPIHHFVYPVGKYDDAVKQGVRQAGYQSALTMNDAVDLFAGESPDLFSIERIGQSQLEEAIAQAYGGPEAPRLVKDFNFTAPVEMSKVTLGDVPLILISGGKPATIHADSRYQVHEIIANTEAIAAVDGGFFSLKYLDSNTMIGPVFSQNTGQFIPGNASENQLLAGRPLVVITPDAVHFVPYDPVAHSSLEGVQAVAPEVTDAFVAAAWLVKDSAPRAPETFNGLFGFDVPRHRAFWGIDQAGQPVIGISTSRVDSLELGELLVQAGFRDAVMLDSGGSTSMAYQGEPLVRDYEPRPVPHVVALMPPEPIATASSCFVLSHDRSQDREP